MMPTNGTATNEESKLTLTEELRRANQAEQDRRDGKTPAVLVKTEEAKPKDGEQDEHHGISRSARREMNRLREAAAEERGRRTALEELLAKGITVSPTGQPKVQTEAEADPEPQRKDFPDDAAYNRAAGRWDARQEARKELEKAGTQGAQAAQVEAVRTEIQEMEKKCEADLKVNFPTEGPDSWMAVAAAAGKPKPANFATDALYEADLERWEKAGHADAEFVPDQHPSLTIMIARSKQKAGVLYHFAKHPEVLRELLELTPNFESQLDTFRQLEGEVKVLYTPKQKPDAKEAKPSTAELDARKPKPSESVAVRGGTATDGKVEMLLPDGKTLNPAWKAEQNTRSGVRR